MSLEQVEPYLLRLFSGKNRLESFSGHLSDTFHDAMDDFLNLNVSLLNQIPNETNEIIQTLNRQLSFLADWKFLIIWYIDCDLRFEAEAYDSEVGFYKFELAVRPMRSAVEFLLEWFPHLRQNENISEALIDLDRLVTNAALDTGLADSLYMPKSHWWWYYDLIERE